MFYMLGRRGSSNRPPFLIFLILLLEIRNLVQSWNDTVMTSVFGWYKDFLCVASVFLVISGFIWKKKLLPFLKQQGRSWGSRGMGTLYVRLGCNAEPKITKQPRNFIKTKIFNHEAGEMHAIWRIQCVIKQ